MANIFSIDGVIPVIKPGSFIHPTATVIGDVFIGTDCYIGPGASLRGDFGRIVLADRVNVQDNCVLHSFPYKQVAIEEGGHIGHGAILHGCHIGRNVLVGMNAVIMDDAVVEDNAFVAASAFVKAGFVVPAQQLAAGTPARLVRALSDREVAWKQRGTEEYVELARRSLASLRPCEPLTQAEPDRPSLNVTPTEPLHEQKQPAKPRKPG